MTEDTYDIVRPKLGRFQARFEHVDDLLLFGVVFLLYEVFPIILYDLYDLDISRKPRSL